MNSTAVVKTRLAFLVIVVLFIITSLFSFNRMNVLNQKTIDMDVSWLPSIVKINGIAVKTSSYRIAELLHVLSLTPQEMEQQEKEMERLTQELATLKKEYEPLISSENERATYQSFLLKYDEYLQASKEALSHSRANENEQAALQSRKSGILFKVFRAELAKLVTLNQVGGAESSRGGNEIFVEAQTVIIIINIVVTIAIFVIMLLIEGWASRTETITVIENDAKYAQASFINRLSIRAKLRAAFLGLAALFMLFTWLSLNRMYLVNQQSTEMEVTWLPAVISVNAVNIATSDLNTAIFKAISSSDANEKMKQGKAIQAMKTMIAEHVQKYEPTINSDEERNIYREFDRKYNEYLAAVDEVLAISRKFTDKPLAVTTDIQTEKDDKPVETTVVESADLSLSQQNEMINTQLQRADMLFNDMSIDLLKLVEFNNKGAKDASHEGDRLYGLSTTVLMGASACVLVLAIFLMVLFEKIVSRPLTRLATIVKEVAGGKVVITKEYTDRYDEVGHIAKAVRDITQTLDTLLRDSAELINAAQMGVLSTRIDAARHPGEFGAIIAGMNQLLAILSKPLVEVAEVMQQLALGNLNKRVEGAYEGDLRTLKANVNRSLDSLVTLLTELSDITKNMAIGDLTHMIEGNYQGDFSALKLNTNQSLKQMKEILTIVVANTEHIALASTQTVSAAEHVSEQSAKQLSALDEVAAAVVETSAAIGQIADNTKRTGELAVSTAELAANGRIQLIKLTEIIEKISDEYKRIEQITTKINRIADKTHLLSLNAGLEAVRAGEHGLGFGFVAQQIGKLAEEASLSARDIGTLIANSSQSVSLSVNTAQQTRIAVENITKAAQESGSAVESISAAITQQSSATDWISEQVSKIQGGGQENAAAAEEIGATMLKLSETIQETHMQVQRFKLA